MTLDLRRTRLVSTIRQLALAWALVAPFVCPSVAQAHGDHNAPAAGAAVPSTPRFATESEAFELVGVLESGTTLRLWLDRWADNAPVRDARIELEIGSTKVTAAPAPDGNGYVATLPAALADGVHPVTATVIASGESDLLAAEIDVHAPTTSSGSPDASGLALAFHRDNRPLVFGLAGAAAAAIPLILFLRSRRARRSST